jgi:hypothetical protein
MTVNHRLINLNPGQKVSVRRFAQFDYRTTGVIKGVQWCSWDGTRLLVEFDCKPGEKPMLKTVRVDKLQGVPRLAKRV